MNSAIKFFIQMINFPSFQNSLRNNHTLNFHSMLTLFSLFFLTILSDLTTHSRLFFQVEIAIVNVPENSPDVRKIRNVLHKPILWKVEKNFFRVWILSRIFNNNNRFLYGHWLWKHNFKGPYYFYDWIILYIYFVSEFGTCFWDFVYELLFGGILIIYCSKFLVFWVRLFQLFVG